MVKVSQASGNTCRAVKQANAKLAATGSGLFLACTSLVCMWRSQRGKSILVSSSDGRGMSLSLDGDVEREDSRGETRSVVMIKKFGALRRPRLR